MHNPNRSADPEGEDVDPASPSSPHDSGSDAIGGASYQFDVALSFAGEDRSYVRRVAEMLRRANIRLFYDEYREAHLWGKDLFTHLDDVYRKNSRYVVMFVSRHYAAKVWTNHERQSAQARAVEQKGDFLLPARFDDTDLPGLRPTVAYIDCRHKTPEELATLILEKAGPTSSNTAEVEIAPASATPYVEPRSPAVNATTSNAMRVAQETIDAAEDVVRLAKEADALMTGSISHDVDSPDTKALVKAITVALDELSWAKSRAHYETSLDSVDAHLCHEAANLALQAETKGVRARHLLRGGTWASD